MKEIYLEARRREAEKIETQGDVEPEVRLAAIDIGHAILCRKLVQVDRPTNMMVYSGFVPHIQNHGDMAWIVLRDKDRKFWDNCIHHCKENHPVCGVGNPGIGKSTTAFYLMEQIVRKEKCPVIYTVRKASETKAVIFYEILPVLDKDKKELIDVTVKVYMIRDEEKVNCIPSMKDHDAFHVVDSGKFKGSCDDSEDHKARFIMIATNDDRHWGGNEFDKNRKSNSLACHSSSTTKKGGIFVYGSLWTEQELLLARNYLALDCSEDTVRERFRTVGGSIRDISEYDKVTFETKVKKALNLDSPTLEGLVNNNYAFPFEPNTPSSILIAVSPQEDKLIYYKTSLKSDYVTERLAMKYLAKSWFDVTNESNAGNRGNLFETYVRRKLSLGSVYFPKEEVRESLQSEPNTATTNMKKNYVEVIGGIAIGSKRTIKRVANLVQAVRDDQTQEKLYYSKNKNEPLVDMIFRVDGGFDAIQTTISKRHSCNVKEIVKLKHDLQLDDAATLRIFYAVPLCRYKEFVTDPVNPHGNLTGHDNVRIYHFAITGKDE